MAIISLENGVSAPRMNAPPPNVSAYEHAKAWRGSAYQVTDKDNCFYCENPGHHSDQCKYLNPAVRNSNWHPDPKLWVYKEGENNGKPRQHRRGRRRSKKRGPRPNKKGKADDLTQVIKTEPSNVVGSNVQDALFPISARPFEVVANNAQAASFPAMAGPFEVAANSAQAGCFPVSIRPPAITGNHAHHASVSTQRSSGFTNAIRNLNFVPLPTDIAATWNIPRYRWAITIGYYRHIANSKDCFVDYHEYTWGEVRHRFQDMDGTVRTAVGLGRVRIDVMLEDGIHGEIILNAVYCPGLPFNLISLDMLLQELGLYYQVQTYSLHEGSTDRMVAHTFEQNYTLFLRTTLE